MQNVGLKKKMQYGMLLLGLFNKAEPDEMTQLQPKFINS